MLARFFWGVGCGREYSLHKKTFYIPGPKR